MCGGEWWSDQTLYIAAKRPLTADVMKPFDWRFTNTLISVYKKISMIAEIAETLGTEVLQDKWELEVTMQLLLSRVG